MKHHNQNQEFRFNEVLFEHRNKEYGAYVLRNESDRILTKALFIGVSLMAAVSITPAVISALKGPSITEQIIACDFGPIDIKNVDTPEVIPPIETVKPATAPDAKTFDSTVPTPSRKAQDNVKNDPVPDDAVAGFKNDFKGNVVPQNTYVPTTAPTGPVINTPPPTIQEPVDKNKIVEAGELGVEANFKGGIDSFRNKVMNSFDGSGFESEEILKTMVTFIVEMDGTISGVKANGTNADFNNEAIRTVKAISNKGTWIPAKNKKGEFVRSYFKFPISMKFDN
ncbi:energy transducer TonB [Chryseobacterium rhizoplanae]|uniref:Energy transducer TonB n=1 Tax=Chryseobacterium bernardetii TaxID=1241978 RepID=A0A3G6TBG0_9FLAO|nr:MULTISPECIES: energy transducer TonB [Chryseobacterium]AZB25219.1 energy transducer TonB [Chryseobacterium bernardetii]UCA59556.1 energy transducer TonB [Chryseobacterium rhizoplanae]